MVSPVGKSGIWATVGVIIIVLTATLGWILYPNILNSQFVLKSGSALFTQWENPPVPISMKFYLFNCTNANDVINKKDTIPVVEEVGPFTYRETRIKQDVVQENGTVTYREVQTYYYDPNENDPSLDVKITTLNPIYTVLAALIDDADISYLKKQSFSTVMHNTLKGLNEGPFMTHTANELLFEGWSLDPYLPIIQLVNSTILHGKVPTLPENLRFGFYFGRNESDIGVTNIDSGINGLEKLATINTWKGDKALNAWPSEYCNMINGTDGEIFPPTTAQTTVSEPEKKLYIFNGDLCRSIYATYEKDQTVSGISGKRFTVPEYVFGDYKSNPDNECFCRSFANNKDTSKCYEAGILDLRPCLHGLPILMSTPHFYQGSETYVNGVKGMDPNQTLHETFFVLEDTTSVTIGASKRIQINLDFQKYSVYALRKVKKTVFPILWADESVILDEDSADLIKLANSVEYGINIGRWSLLGVGIAITVGSAIAAAVLCKKRGFIV